MLYLLVYYEIWMHRSCGVISSSPQPGMQRSLHPSRGGRPLRCFFRRYRDIAAQIIADMGGPSQCAEARLQLIRRFLAKSSLLPEQMGSTIGKRPLDRTSPDHALLSSTWCVWRSASAGKLGILGAATGALMLRIDDSQNLLAIRFGASGPTLGPVDHHGGDRVTILIWLRRRKPRARSANGNCCPCRAPRSFQHRLRGRAPRVPKCMQFDARKSFHAPSERPTQVQTAQRRWRHRHQ